MKQKLLLALLALFTLGGSNLFAQTWTDKTSVITNPSFEDDEAISDLKGCGWATDRVTGWTIAPSSPGNSQVGVGNSSSIIQGIAASFDPSDGDKYFYMRENWNPNTTFSISQTIQHNNIPAGFYRLTVKAAMFSSVASTYTLSLQEGGQTAATNSFSYAGTANNENWRDWSVVLYKQSDDTDLTITAAYKTPSENSGGKHYCMLLDDVKLEYVAPSSVSSTNTFDITDFIKNPGFDNNSGDGWTMTTTFTNWGANAISNGNKQQWNGNFSVSQELPKLPNGVYELGVQGFYRPGGNDSQSTDKNAVLFAFGNQEVTSPLMLVSAGGSASKDDTNGYTTAYTGVDPNVYVPNSQGDAEKAFGANGYSDNSLRVIVTDGSLTIGVKKETLINNDWTVIDNFSLKYLGTDLLLAEVIAAWETAHAALADLDADALPTAAKNAITEELAKDRPDTEERIVAATAAMQALIDSYDGIKAAFNEYKALKAQVEDLKNTNKYNFTGDEALSTFNNTLSEIDGNAEAATDAATLTALLPELRTAGNTFVGGIESNDGFDLTYNVINNSFETGALSPWTTNGSNDTGVRENSNGTYTTTGVDGAYLFNTWNNGAGSKVSQTLSNLPTGYYTVTALVASDAGNTINILAGATTKAVEADATNGKNQFVEGTTDKTLVSDGSLEIGTNSSTWYKADNFRLTFYTETAGARDAWLAAKAAAEAARDNAEYENVTGAEKTALLAEIAKAEPSSATAEAYGTATTALQEATSAFIAAKDSYDGLVAMRAIGKTYTTEAWPRADADKKEALDEAIAAEPENAADAVTKTNAIVTAYRQFVESNGLAEGVEKAVDKTSLLLVSDANVSTTGWTSGSIGTNSGQSYTTGEGETVGKYFDGGWSSNAGVNLTLTQNLTLPAGQYQLQITARGSSSLTTYNMSIGEESVDLPKDGNTGGTFGNGWSDKYIVFTSDGSEQTLTITASSTEHQQWISFNRLRLVKLNATFADATDYANLNTAIAAAEAKQLGFEDGEYAPYNNVEVLTKLAEAKAIDQTANNEQETVQALTTYLTTPTNWTANSGDVDAIYNGMFAKTGTGSNPKGWTRSNNGWGQQITGLTAAENGVNEGTTTAWYYNNNGAWQYGNDGVYTMPLAAETTYMLTFKYAKHDNDGNNWMKASVLNSDNEGLEVAQYPGATNNTMYQKATAYFTTGAAGNYILSIEQNGNAHLTDVSLVKAESATKNFDEASTTYTPELAYYETVSLTRSLQAGDKWNTFCVPFDMVIPEGWTVKEFDSAEGNTINFKNAESIVAGKPYIVKLTEAVTNPTYSNVVVKSTVGEIMGQGDYKFAAQIFNKSLATDGSIAYMTTSGQIKKLTSGGIKGLRAYFIIPANGESARIHFVEEDETTGIDAIDGVIVENGNIYDLQGRKVETMKRGIYIVNGKKVVIK